MPFPKLSPLQSRLAASVIASVMLILFYFTFAFSPSHFAYAADVDSIRPEDHNHDRILDMPFLEADYEDLDLRGISYAAEFLGVERGIIGERATTDSIQLPNNGMVATNIEQGKTLSYMFANASLWGTKSPVTPGLPGQIILSERVSTKDGEESWDGPILEARQSRSGNGTLYISVTACSLPGAVSNTTTALAPQLQLYISESENNTTPGPTQDPTKQAVFELEEGYLLYTLNATGDVYVGVYAPNNTAYSGVYNFEIAMSIDAPFHYYWNSSDPNLFVVDSDDSSALLFTDPFMTDTANGSLYDEWMDMTPPFVIFGSDSQNVNLTGVQRSYCGLQNSAEISATRPGQTVSNIVTGMTSVGKGTLPKQQFYVNGLSPGKNYLAALAMNGNSTSSGSGVVGGGGQVFRMTSFDTITADNCAVIYGLSFCDQIAYAVPTNPNTFPNMSSLAAFYDNGTQSVYSNFQKVMAQIACETTSSAQYSLARTCDDCRNAYKEWLCTVSMPRCTDFTSAEDWLVPRAMGQPFPNGTFLPQAQLMAANDSAPMNGSRNPLIDEFVIPGPYKEILPCDELCYSLVQSCPASLGFGCPTPNDIGFNQSYGIYPQGQGDSDGRIFNNTCNYPGVPYYQSGGGRVLPSVLFGLVGLVVSMLLA